MEWLAHKDNTLNLYLLSIWDSTSKFGCQIYKNKWFKLLKEVSETVIEITWMVYKKLEHSGY